MPPMPHPPTHFRRSSETVLGAYAVFDGATATSSAVACDVSFLYGRHEGAKLPSALQRGAASDQIIEFSRKFRRWDGLGPWFASHS